MLPNTPDHSEQGTVTRLLLGQGFGWIRADDGTQRFFHANENPEFFNLTIGARVEYVPVQHEKGPRADHVRKIEHAERSGD